MEVALAAGARDRLGLQRHHRKVVAQASAGFDGIELNYDLENDLSPKSGKAEYQAIRKMAEKIGIEISGICSFLY